VPGQQELFEYMNLQYAKPAAEGDLLFGRDVLVTKDQHVVIQVSPVDAGKRFVVDRQAQVKADDLGTYCAGKRTNFEGLLLCAVVYRQSD
jgi:hypothetical protein